MKKRITAILLVLSVVLGTSACSSGKETSVSDTKTAPDSNSSSSADTNAPADTTASESRFAGETGWKAPYDETVTLTIANEQHTSAKFPDGDDMADNIWIRSYLKDLNIEVVTDWVSTEYETKMNLSIASQTLPDVFRVNAAQFQQLLDADLLMDITDVYESTASESVKSFLTAEDDVTASAMRDGRLYGIPSMFYGYIDKPSYLWLRKDWMQELDLSAPQSITAMEETFLAMMEKYGGYGLAVDKSLDYLYYMAPMWHAYPKVWIEDESGNIEYGNIQPEMKQALATWADWYAKGILKPDFGTMDFNAVREDVVNGKVGAHPFQHWWGFGLGPDQIRNNNADAYFEPYLFPSADGGELKYPVEFPNSSYTVINKNCQNPEAAIKLVNYYNYMTLDAYVEGDVTMEEMLPYTQNDLAHITGPFYIMNPLGEYNQYLEIQEALETKDMDYKFSTAAGAEKFAGTVDWMENGTPEGIGYVLQIGAANSAYTLGKEIVDKDAFVKSKVWGALPEALANYGSTLDDLLIEGFTKIIMGAEPVDYFDTLVENWKTAGGDEATAAVNEMYGNR